MPNVSYKKWNQSDLDFIQNNSTLLDKELATKLSQLSGQSVTQAMVRRQRRKMGIGKKRGRPPKNVATQTPLNIP